MASGCDIPPDDRQPTTPELVLVGGKLDQEVREEPVPRRPPLPTLHLAAHEIISFPAPKPQAEPS